MVVTIKNHKKYRGTYKASTGVNYSKVCDDGQAYDCELHQNPYKIIDIT